MSSDVVRRVGDELAKPWSILDGIRPAPPPSQPPLPQFLSSQHTQPPSPAHPFPHPLTFPPSPHLPLFTLDGDSTGGRITGDLVGEVCGEGCDGREGRREAGSLPAHVPVVPLSRAAGSSGGRSEGGEEGREERRRNKKRDKARKQNFVHSATIT